MEKKTEIEDLTNKNTARLIGYKNYFSEINFFPEIALNIEI